MIKRVTIVISPENDRRVRNLQAKLIKKENGTVSFSRVINDILKEAL